MTEIALQRLSGALGARVDGVDLARASGKSIDAIKAALARHKVLVLHDQRLDAEELLAFGRAFGEPEVHTFFPTLGDGLEQVTVLDSRAGYRSNRWHADETFLAAPPIITMLHAQEIPEYGDDTLWTDMELAFEALSPRLREYIDGLTAVHDIALQGERDVQLGKNDPAWVAELISMGHRVEHPVVRRHPITGTRSLYVNPVYTRFLVGIPPEENELILPYLFRHCTIRISSIGTAGGRATLSFGTTAPRSTLPSTRTRARAACTACRFSKTRTSRRAACRTRR